MRGMKSKNTQDDSTNLGILSSSARSLSTLGADLFSGIQVAGNLGLLALAAPYTITFYLIYRKLFKKKLNRLTKKNIERQIFLVRETCLSFNDKIKDLNIGLSYLKSDLSSKPSNKLIETEINKKSDEIKQTEELLDEALVRLEFLLNLKMLLERKEFLKQKGLWSNLNELSKRSLKNLDDNITKYTYENRKVKVYLENLNHIQWGMPLADKL